MAKCLVILMILLIVSVFFAGCKPELVEPPQVEPQKPTILEPEPPKVEPPMPEPNQVEPNGVSPVEMKPSGAEPNKVGPATKVSFHNKCADILTSFVDDEGMVGYKELRRKKLELNRLLDEFDKLDPNEYKSWSREDKIAFWINACNMKMLKIIVDNYPIQSTRILRILWGPDSVRHIDKNIGGIWKSKFMVMDEEFTLAEIQKRFFRKEFDEPRAFLAVSLACLSGPPLRNEPYYGYKLYEQLDEQTKKFLSGPRALRIDEENSQVYLSAILKPTWYGKEFVSRFGTDKKFKDQQPADRAVLNFLASYISSRDVSFLEVENYTIEYMKFDWTLNNGSQSMSY